LKKKKLNPAEIAKDDASFKLWVVGMLNRHEGMLKVLIPLVIATLALVVGLYLK